MTGAAICAAVSFGLGRVTYPTTAQWTRAQCCLAARELADLAIVVGDGGDRSGVKGCTSQPELGASGKPFRPSFQVSSKPLTVGSGSVEQAISAKYLNALKRRRPPATRPPGRAWTTAPTRPTPPNHTPRCRGVDYSCSVAASYSLRAAWLGGRVADRTEACLARPPSRSPWRSDPTSTRCAPASDAAHRGRAPPTLPTGTAAGGVGRGGEVLSAKRPPRTPQPAERSGPGSRVAPMDVALLEIGCHAEQPC